MKNKITAKFPDNIERPVEGHKCKLTVVSIILCVFFTSAQLLGAGTEMAE